MSRPGNLDFTTGTEILDLLWDSCDRLGQTIVLVTHDARAAAYADRVLVVRDGEILETIELGRRARPRGAAADHAPGRAGPLARASLRGRLARAWPAGRCARALTVLGVALGVAVIAAALMAGQAATEAVRRAAQELFGSASLRVRAFEPEGFTPRTVQNIQTISGVNTGSAVIEERGRSVTTKPGPDEKVFTMLLIGVDPQDEAQIRSYELVDGQFLDPADPTGVLVNAAWARANGLRVGDELWLNSAPHPPYNHIVGLLGDAGFGALGSGSVVVLDSDYLSEAFEVPRRVRYVDLKVAEGAEDEVLAALDRTMTEPFVVETVADAEQQLGRAQAGFAGLAFLFGLVALAVGAFLVANTLAMTLAERTREIGLLRAAGTTSRQVMGLFLRQGLALGLIGGLVGVLLGVAMAAILITVLQSSRALLIGGLPFHPVALLLAFVLGALVTLAGALVPALAASRVSPLDALRPSQQPGRTLGGRLPWVMGLVIAAVAVGVVAYPLQRGDASLSGALLAVGILLGGTLLVALGLQPLARLIGRPFGALFGAQGELGRANLGRDPVRTGLTVGALAIGLGVGGGARHRHGLRPRDGRRVGALHPARWLRHPPDACRTRSIECGTTWRRSRASIGSCPSASSPRWRRPMTVSARWVSPASVPATSRTRAR